MALMRSLNNSNKDALSGNAGHGDADGITQPNKDARCTGTEDFFQSSSNFKSADAATLTEARALTALRAARAKNTKTSRRQSSVHGLHFPRITTQQSRTPPPPPDRPTNRSVGGSIVRALIHPSSASRPVDRARRADRVPSTVVDARIKIHRVSSRARLPRPTVARASSRVLIPRAPRSRISVAYRSRVPPRCRSVRPRPRRHRRRRPRHRLIPNARTPSSSHRASTHLAARAPSASPSARARILA